jgi:hypothetical protein
MNRYYISKINLKKLRHKLNLLSVLEKKYKKKIFSDNIILSINGYYKFEKDTLVKYKIVQKDCHEMSYNDTTVIGNTLQHIKSTDNYNFPPENKQINLKKFHFYNENNRNIYLVLEYFNNKLNDIYFLSKKDIRENNMFFLHDISSFIETLNI